MAEDILMVRIYLSEAKLAHYRPLLDWLHSEHQVRGMTLFRGIQGFGHSGRVHSADLLDLALDLPLVIEFFDSAARVRALLPRLEAEIEPGHLVYWSARANQ